MKRIRSSLVAIAAGLFMLGCSSATEPTHADVDLARSEWLNARPAVYSFEVAIETSWFPKSGFYHVDVANGHVVAARDSAGVAVSSFSLTLDGIWDQILAARARDELNSALFDRRGVPVESDMGPWAVDGGLHYSVRNFATAPSG